MSLVNKRGLIKNSVKLCAPLWLIILLFLSCQSIPKSSDTFLEGAQFLPLDAGASAYIIANVQEAQHILNLLPINELKNKHAKQMLDRTNVAAVAIFPEGSDRRFQIIAWGNYPNSSAGMAFTFNRDWKKHRSPTGQSYWFSKENKLSLILKSRQASVAVLTNDTPTAPSSSAQAAEIPESFLEFSRGLPLACWLENPAPILSRILNEAGIPIRFPVSQLFLNLNTAAAQQYEATIRLQFENQSQARGMSAILNLAGGFASDDPIASLLLANQPIQNGRYLDIKTAPLSEKDLLHIFEILTTNK